MQVPFYRHGLSAADAAAVAGVLDTPFLTTGALTRQVEAQLAAFFDAPHALLTNSWTNGAVATLLALGVGPGDEVIVPAMTFIATANAAELVGARPVFADVDPDTLLMTPQTLRPKVTARTAAVIPVHLYGRLCDVAALVRCLEDAPRRVAVIEDAAHAFEATRDGHPPGRVSDAAIFSFYATKNVTCGEGGAIVTHNPELAARLAMTRLHGMSAGAADRHAGARYRHWDMTVLGTKANLPDLLAALLPRQIETIRDRLPMRQALAARYRDALAARADLRLPAMPPGCTSAWHLFAVDVGGHRRDRVLAALGQAGIGCTVSYRSVPTLTYYRTRYGFTPDDHPVSRDWGDGTISLPFFPGLTEDQQGYVSACLIETLDRIREPAVGGGAIAAIDSPSALHKADPMTPTIDQLYRYPVKGLSADPLDTVALAADQGMPEDRRFAITHGGSEFDPLAPRWLPRRNFVVVARTERLAALDTGYDADTQTLVIRRNGRPVARGSLTTVTGRAVIEQFLAAYLARDVPGVPKIVEAPGVMFSDSPDKLVSVINLASVGDLERVTKAPVHPLRFRGNVYLSNLPAWQETRWVGATLAIGAVRLVVVDPIERCAATAVDPVTGARDLNIPKALQQGFDHCLFGVFARVAVGGRISRGDPVTVTPAPSSSCGG